ncbi:hypothetical protein D3C79_994530 [compost metagenome]
MIEGKRQSHRVVELCFAVHFADADGGALVRRFDKQRQAEAGAEIGKCVLLAVGTGQGDKRRHIQPGIAQQALGDVFIHAGGGTEHVGADERQIRHPQHPL